MENIKAPFNSYEEYVNFIVTVVTRLQGKYEISDDDMVGLIDNFKTTSNEYHKLMVANKVPKQNQYTLDPEQADKSYREIMGS